MEASQLWHQAAAGGRTSRVGKKKIEKGANRRSEKTNREEHRLLQLFTPDFTSLSLSLSLRSARLTDWLTDWPPRQKNVRNTRRVVKVTAWISTPLQEKKNPAVRAQTSSSSRSDRPLQGAGANWHRCALCALPTHASERASERREGTAHANSGWACECGTRCGQCPTERAGAERTSDLCYCEERRIQGRCICALFGDLHPTECPTDRIRSSGWLCVGYLLMLKRSIRFV